MSFQLPPYVRAILPFSLPLKLLFSAFVSFVGAGLLGVVSEYATYSYALYYGIRPPLEGVPYLRAAVSFGSLFLLVTGTIIFASTYLVFSAFMKSMPLMMDRVHSPILDSVAEGLSHHLVRVFRLKNVAFVFLAGVAAALVTAVMFLFIRHFLKDTKLDAAFFYLLFFGAFFLYLTIAFPSLVWWYGGFVTLGYFALFAVLLFIPSYYSGLLRLVGYGGGLPVQIEYRETDQRTRTLSAHLMLRTTESLILYRQRENDFVELPRDQVRHILHPGGRLWNLTYMLPNNKISLSTPVP